MGARARHKQGTLAGVPDDRNPQLSQKPAHWGVFHHELHKHRARRAPVYGPRLVRSALAKRCGAALRGVVDRSWHSSSRCPSRSVRTRPRRASQTERLRVRSARSARERSRRCLETCTRSRPSWSARAAQRARRRTPHAGARAADATTRAPGGRPDGSCVSERRLAELLRALYQQQRHRPARDRPRRGLARRGAGRPRRASTAPPRGPPDRRADARARRTQVRLAPLDSRGSRPAEASSRRLARPRRSARRRELAAAAPSGRRTSRSCAAGSASAEVDRARGRAPRRARSRRFSTPLRERRSRAARGRSRLRPATARGDADGDVDRATALRGRTASGLPAGPGIAAVDPSVIPLGTRMVVPGLRRGRRGRHGRRGSRRRDRPLVPDACGGTPLGAADRHDHAALTRASAAADRLDTPSLSGDARRHR